MKQNESVALIEAFQNFEAIQRQSRLMSRLGDIVEVNSVVADALKLFSAAMLRIESAGHEQGEGETDDLVDQYLDVESGIFAFTSGIDEMWSIEIKRGDELLLSGVFCDLTPVLIGTFKRGEDWESRVLSW